MASQVLKIGDRNYSVYHDHYENFWKRVENGSWEPELLEVMKILIDPTTLFFDIGAWIGPTTLYAASLGAEVYAFEPDPLAYRRLIRNVSLNKECSHLIKIFNAACGQAEGNLTLYADDLGNSETSVFKSRRYKSIDEESLTVVKADVVDINKVIKNLHIRNRNLFLKIDIEGYEFELVPYIAAGMKDFSRAVINVSTHPFNIKSDDVAIQQKNRYKAKNVIFSSLVDYYFYELIDDKLQSLTHEKAQKIALDNLDEPDFIIASTYDILEDDVY